MNKIQSTITQDFLKKKSILIYGILLSILGWGVFLIEQQPEKSILVLLQITLIVVPLMTGIFATIYYYNSKEFIQTLLIQPIRRSRIIWGIFTGLLFGFSISFIIGIGLPLILYYPSAPSLFLIISGLLLCIIFTGLSLLISVHQVDKARSMAIILMLWVFFTFVFDGALLWVMYQWSDYPIEPYILTSTFFNPVSISRLLVVMQTEAAALLGLSGAIFREFFGTLKGSCIAITLLIFWAIIPYLIARKKFIMKDF